MPSHNFFVAFVLLISAGAAAAQTPLAPFVMPWNDAAPAAVNLQGWQPEEAGNQGWIATAPDGHYYLNGARLRILGINITSASAFPAKDLAEGHAARLAKFGFNAVRFHHLEAPWDKSRVLIDYSKGNSRTLSTERLDRLHYFVAQLAARGLYSNINLLVSREFQRGDGLGDEIAQMGWKDQHVLGFFSEDALALHKEHARNLLRAPNPYRDNRPLAEDPAVAFVEIMNENGLLQKWYEGVLDGMPARYRAQLGARWNEWLRAKYSDTVAMLDAWGAVDSPLGNNMLLNGDFANGTSNWNIERHSGAAATVTVPAGFQGKPALRVEVTTPGQANWHVQVNQSRLALEEKGVYTVSFWARAESPTPLFAAIGRAYGDYGTISPGPSVTLGTDWRSYTWTFQNAAADANARVNFNGFGDRRAAVLLADVKVQPGGRIGGLPEGTSLEAANVPAVRRVGSGGGYTSGQVLDWTRFALSAENAYWNEMRRYVKEDLGYPGIVWATIISNSPPNAQAGMDAMDSHAYWQHPQFPGIDWDAENWYVTNVSMVNNAQGGTLSVARQRVEGLPQNFTEYQHPSPNTYATEGPILSAAYAALQDWDSIWFFCYETTRDEFTTGFFDHGGNPGKMANNLLAALLFRRGDVSPAVNSYVFALTPEREARIAATVGGAWNVADAGRLGVPAPLGLVSRIGMRIGPDATGLDRIPPAPVGPVLVSDNEQLRWDTSIAGKGVFTGDTPRTKVVSGFTAGREFVLGDVTIAPGATRQDWCTLGIGLLEGDSFSSAAGARAIIVATGDNENTGQVWKDQSKTSVGTRWGRAPALIETVSARITLPVPASRVQAWALDGTGQRMSALEIEEIEGRAALKLGANGATLWYEVVIAPADALF